MRLVARFINKITRGITRAHLTAWHDARAKIKKYLPIAEIVAIEIISHSRLPCSWNSSECHREVGEASTLQQD